MQKNEQKNIAYPITQQGGHPYITLPIICRSYSNLVISDFTGSGEATEVRAKLETFMGYRLAALKLMAEVTQ